MKNIFKISREEKIAKLGRKLINELQKNWLKLEQDCMLVDIWIHHRGEVEIEYANIGGNVNGGRICFNLYKNKGGK